MAVILTDEGSDDQLAKLWGGEAINMRVGLYTANAGAARAVTKAQLTEATFSGYAAQTPVWSVIADSAAGRSKMEAAEMTFQHNGGGVSNVVLGWFLYHNGSSKCWFYEAFGAGMTIDSVGDNIKIKPTIFYGELTAPL